MNLDKKFNFYKVIIIIVGLVCFLSSAVNLNSQAFTWQFLLLLFFTLTIAPKLILSIPRSKSHLSFSDSLIFISFLFYDGHVAIFIATIETLANCLYLKYQGLVFNRHAFLYNITSTTVCTSLTFLSYSLFSSYFQLGVIGAGISSLIVSLGCLAFFQFIYTSIMASVFYALKSHISLWSAWKNEFFSFSTTQIAGASIAGITFKLFNNDDYFVSGIVSVVLVIAYVNYRKVIKDISKSNEEADEAQKGKAESERMKAEQAEQHAGELAVALTEQESISEQLQESNHALEHSAFYDSLTDLPNRAYLIERLRLLFELKIDISHKYYILFIDLKRFKNINNRLGHEAGDKVLIMIAKRLLRLVKQEDTVARLGGDEFAIILNDLKSPEEAVKYARKISQKLSQPFSLQGHKIFVSVNIGISPFEAEHRKPEDILRDADIAMHYSKEKETDYALFDKDLRARVMETIKLESNLRFALDKEELSMHYQPLISLTDGEIIGFEALLRWHHPTIGFIPPVKFIPIAEDSGLIIPITEWILEETTNQIAKWQKISPNYQNLIVSVNISGKHISQDGLVGTVKNALRNSQLNSASLKLEVTESIAMEDAERTIKVLSKLKELGTQLSIDDFGTGYSSLSYLHRLPFDTLKIDRSFVYSVGENGENSEILQTIISLAKNLRMRVIAEGIETESQLRLLRNLGCDYGQGYLLSKPLPKDEIEILLYQKHLWFPQSFTEEEFGTTISDNIQTDVIYPSKISQ